MGILKNLLDSRTVRNAVQEMYGSNSGSGITSLYTRDISKYFEGINKGGQYDNYYGDYNRIITTAPTFPFYYVNKNGEVDETSAIALYLDEPNTNFPQYKVLQQIYSEMLTRGYSEIFLWHKQGKNDTNIFEPGKKYAEETFRGITLVAGYDPTTLKEIDKKNIIRIHYGVSQSNIFLGYSPTQAAAAWRKMQDEMGLHMTAFARNAGMPIGQFIITAKNPEEFAKLRDKLAARIAGAKNNGKVLFNYRPSDSKDAQIEWVQFTSQDVQDYTPQLEFSEKKMSQGFGVPGTIKGTNDKENYATARVSEQVFIKYTIKPLNIDLKTQLIHAMKQRFKIAGEIKSDVIIPEIADESLVRIQATTQQVALYDKKIAEGYDPESIVRAYNLPESFLLLEKTTSTAKSENSARKTHNHAHVKNEFTRRYQNTLTDAEKESLESEFRKITQEYADLVLKNGVVESDRDNYVGKMSVTFSSQYSKLYGSAVNDVADELLKVLESADIAELDLTDEELEAAVSLYKERVSDFSATFSENIAQLPGKTLEVRQAAAQPHIDRVVVTESEHTRIVSELDSWTKAQEEFPVRVYKTWHTQEDENVCPECAAEDGIQIDVTALFVNNSNISEIYEVTGGGMHPNCRCFVTYEMEGEDVRKFEGGDE